MQKVNIKAEKSRQIIVLFKTEEFAEGGSKVSGRETFDCSPIHTN